jgi:hypothetical protein
VAFSVPSRSKVIKDRVGINRNSIPVSVRLGNDNHSAIESSGKRDKNEDMPWVTD